MAASSERRSKLSQKVSNRAAREVAGFDGWYNGRLEQELAESLGDVANNAAMVSALQAETYGSMVIEEMTGASPLSATENLSGTARIGVTASVAYGRVAKRYGYIRSLGYSPDAAKASAIDRVRRMMDLEVGLASRMQMQRLFSQNTQTITGYRRVIRPELSKTGVCGLCIAASDRIYSTGEMMPIHPGCYCETLPIVGNDDPGFSLNTADITRLYRTADQNREVGAPTRSQLSSVRMVEYTHGEYGPMLRDSQEALKTVSNRQGR